MLAPLKKKVARFLSRSQNSRDFEGKFPPAAERRNPSPPPPFLSVFQILNKIDFCLTQTGQARPGQPNPTLPPLLLKVADRIHRILLCRKEGSRKEGKERPSKLSREWIFIANNKFAPIAKKNPPCECTKQMWKQLTRHQSAAAPKRVSYSSLSIYMALDLIKYWCALWEIVDLNMPLKYI